MTTTSYQDREIIGSGKVLLGTDCLNKMVHKKEKVHIIDMFRLYWCAKSTTRTSLPGFFITSFSTLS